MNATAPTTTTRPVRVAPLVPLALAAAAGVAADRYAGPYPTPAWASAAAAFGVLGLLAVRTRWLGVVAVVVAVGAAAGAWHHCRWSDLADDDLARGLTDTPRPAWLRGVIRDAPGYRPGRGGVDKGATRLVLDVRAVRAAGGWRPASGRAMVTVAGDRSDLPAGADVEAAGGLAMVAGPLNPGEFDYRASLRAQGVRLRLSVDDPVGVWRVGGPSPRDDLGRRASRWLGGVRAWSQARLADGLGPETTPLAAALVLGRREGVDPDVNDAFARTGTTHLLAISGLHMQVLAVALGSGLMALGVGRRGTFAAVALATLAYALLVGLLPSVVRSAAMTWTGCAAGSLDRKERPANTLAVAALVTLALNPSHLFDVGCQLSFLAVGAIVWGAPPVSSWALRGRGLDPLVALERRFEPGWRGRLRSGRDAGVRGAVISAVVWLAALPLVALRFHIVSPIGVPLNVPLVPLTSAALLASGVSLALAAVWGPLGRPAGWAAGWLLVATERVVRWGAARGWGHWFVAEPSWAWVLGFYLLLGLAAAAAVGRWPRPWAWALAGVSAGWAAVGLGAAVAPAVAAPGGPPAAEVLAVGHGLAVVIETGGGRAVLYDCGRMRDPSVGRRVIAPALWARGVRRLDAVVLSHADADHYNGLPDLLDRVPVGAVLVPAGFAGAANPGATELLAMVRSRGVAVRTVAAGESWSAGASRFAVLHPPAGADPSATDNARSVVLDVSWHGRRVLLTGDLEGPGLSALVGRPRGGPVDVLLSPHHGGRTANPPRLFAWSDPALVVVSQRPPPAGSRDALDGLKPPVLRTWRRGAVRLSWAESGVTASGYLDGPGPPGGGSSPRE